MRVVVISDTHERHEELGVLEGDVLVHCGDGQQHFGAHPEIVQALDDWFARQRFRHVLAIGGNHDFALFAGTAFRHATLLTDAGFEVDGVRFWGSPWTPMHDGWAFHADEAQLREKWARIPDDTDVLVTHTPPLGVLDRPTAGGQLGCPHLLDAVRRVEPRLHVFGHVHASGGQTQRGPTHFVNAACVHRGGFRGAVVVDI